MPRVKIYLPKPDAAPEVRRWQINSYQDLQRQLADILGMSMQAGKLEYRDDEQDWVVLSNESEWEEAVLTLGEAKSVLQLRFTPKQKKSPPMPPQRKSSAQMGAASQQQQQAQEQAPSFLGSLPQRAMHQVSNLEEYFQRLHAEQQMQKLQEQRQQQRMTPQSAGTPHMLQQMFRRPSEVSSQEIQPPQSPQIAATARGMNSPLTRSPLTRQQDGIQQQQRPQPEQHSEHIHIPFEDFLKQFGGKILGLVHPSHQPQQQQQQKKAATPNSALPQHPHHAFFQQVQPKARSHSDSNHRNATPRIILHPASSMIGNAYAVPPMRSKLTTMAPSDLPLSRDEASNPSNLENIHKEEREERQQVESMAQTPKEMTPLPTLEDLGKQQRERFLRDPHLEDLSSDEMDSILDTVLDQDEPKLQEQQKQQQDSTAVAPEAVENSGPVKLSNEDARIIARPQSSSPFVPTAPEGAQSPVHYEIHDSSAQQEEADDEQQYEHTMKLLENIGFENKKLNQHLLHFHKGNVNDTIHALLKLSQQEDEHH